MKILLSIILTILSTNALAAWSGDDTPYYYRADYSGQFYGEKEFDICEEQARVVAGNFASAGKIIVNAGCSVASKDSFQVVVAYRTLELFEDIEKYRNDYIDMATCNAERPLIAARLQLAKNIIIDSYCYSYYGATSLMIDYLVDSDERMISNYNRTSKYELENVCKSKLEVIKSNLVAEGFILINSECSKNTFNKVTFRPIITYSHLRTQFIYDLAGEVFSSFNSCENEIKVLHNSLEVNKLAPVELFCSVRKTSKETTYRLNANFIKNSDREIRIEEGFLRPRVENCKVGIANISKQLISEGKKIVYKFCKKENKSFKGYVYFF